MANMALVNFAKTVLVFVLVCDATKAAPVVQQADLSTNGSTFLSEELTGVKEAKPSSQTEDSIPSRLRAGGAVALEESGKILRTAAMLPAETLQLIRMLTLPLLNATLAMPANALEGAASMSLNGLHEAGAHARSSAHDLLGLLLSLKDVKHHLLPHIAFQKNITIGSLILKKTFELGASSSTKPPAKPAPEVYTKPTSPPAVVDPVTEPPKGCVSAPIVTTPPAVAVATPVLPLPAVTPVVVAPVVVPTAVVPGGDQVQVANVVGSKPEIIQQEKPGVIAVGAPQVPTAVVPVAVAPTVVAPSDGDQVQVANVVQSDPAARAPETTP